MTAFPTLVHHMANRDDSPYPPNSLEGIRSCLEADAAVIEVDIMALAEDDYLLVHDPILENETSGSGEVGLCSVAAARSLSIRHRSSLTQYRVPLLSEVVSLFMQHGGETRLQLDFKNVYPTQDDALLKRLITLIEPLQRRVIVSSGADWHLRRMHVLAPWLDLGFDIGFYLDYRPNGSHPQMPPFRQGAFGLYDDQPLSMRQGVAFARYMDYSCEALVSRLPTARVWYVNHYLLVFALDRGFNMAEWLRAHGVLLDGWTLDAHNPTAVAHARRLRDAGVALLTTNTPHALQEVLAVPERN